MAGLNVEDGDPAHVGREPDPRRDTGASGARPEREDRDVALRIQIGGDTAVRS